MTTNEPFMSHGNDRGSEEPKLNYYVRDAGDGNPQLTIWPARRGYPTVAAAKDAEIKDIQDRIAFCLDDINGFRGDIKEAKTEEDRKRLYLEINGLMNEIEKDRKWQEKVRRLGLEDKSL